MLYYNSATSFSGAFPTIPLFPSYFRIPCCLLISSSNNSWGVTGVRAKSNRVQDSYMKAACNCPRKQILICFDLLLWAGIDPILVLLTIFRWRVLQPRLAIPRTGNLVEFSQLQCRFFHATVIERLMICFELTFWPGIVPRSFEKIFGEQRCGLGWSCHLHKRSILWRPGSFHLPSGIFRDCKTKFCNSWVFFLWEIMHALAVRGMCSVDRESKPLKGKNFTKIRVRFEPPA